MIQVDHDAVAWSEVGDEVILLHLADSEYMELNETGAHMWHQLLAGTTADDLVASLVGVFDVDAETARSDVTTLLAELRECGLVIG